MLPGVMIAPYLRLVSSLRGGRAPEVRRTAGDAAVNLNATRNNQSDSRCSRESVWTCEVEEEKGRRRLVNINAF